jgi:hypothetical protein
MACDPVMKIGGERCDIQVTKFRESVAIAKSQNSEIIHSFSRGIKLVDGAVTTTIATRVAGWKMDSPVNRIVPFDISEKRME